MWDLCHANQNDSRQRALSKSGLRNHGRAASFWSPPVAQCRSHLATALRALVAAALSTQRLATGPFALGALTGINVWLGVDARCRHAHGAQKSALGSRGPEYRTTQRMLPENTYQRNTAH